MQKLSTIQELAKQCQSYMEQGQRTDKNCPHPLYYYSKDTAPQWFKDLCYKAHKIDDILPNDYIYDYIKEAIDIIANNENPQDVIYEIEPDCMTFDLLQWVSNNLCFMTWADNVLKEGFEPKSLSALLQMAQANHKQAIANNVLISLEEHLKHIS